MYSSACHHRRQSAAPPKQPRALHAALAVCRPHRGSTVADQASDSLIATEGDPRDRMSGFDVFSREVRVEMWMYNYMSCVRARVCVP